MALLPLPFVFLLLLAQSSTAVPAVSARASEGCPTPPLVQAALQARFGTSGPVDERWRVEYEANAADRLTVELRDETKRVVLRRELPRRQIACESVADAIAIVVERYFHQVGWTTGAPLPPAAPPAPSPAKPTTQTRIFAHVGPVVDAIARMDLAVSLGVFVGGSRLGAQVRAVLWTAGRHEELAGTAVTSMRSASLALSAPVTLAGGVHAALLAGPGLLIDVDRGRSVGLVDESPAVRATTLIGADAMLRCSLTKRLGAVAIAGSYRRVSGGHFRVAGADAPVLTRPDWQVLLGLALEWRLMP